MKTLLFSLIPILLLAGICNAEELDTPYALNTQADGEHPPTAEASAAMISVPDGFKVTLFAGDPYLHQPIAFDIDDRGRLWVVECYTYEGGEYDLSKRDRIVIFEDSDHDGRFDQRKIFWDQGQRLTGITLGFGGVWMTMAPHLLFLPDRDGDDVPDGEPETMLEGFSTLARHNMVNGLRWGPDGWLYGRHGITDTSTVGTPQTPLGKRIRLNCSIWRFHPQRQVFEVVTHGTTNPWGLDYDDHGQWFFTNNVINHLWHVVPGAHYERMHGDDFNPHLYQLISPTADHFHWDTKGGAGETNNPNRKQYDGRHDSYGGGHSHAGGMIYLGDNWPQGYRGMMLMCNTHGRRVNADRLERQGNSYIGKHEADFLIANNQWFRGVELKYGPDGGVFVTDWSDLGECHDRDGVHRTSGRIYKITHDPIESRTVNLAAMTSDDLVELQLHRNDWFVRHARRLLQERAVAGDDLSSAIGALHHIYETHPDVTRRLRAMWALFSLNAVDSSWLVRQLDDSNEHIRAWAVRMTVDGAAPDHQANEKLTHLAQIESSGLVRVYLASALQRLDSETRWQIAAHLVARTEDADDRVQPLMIWYGIESAAAEDPNRALLLARESMMPILRRHIARRLTSVIDRDPESVNRVIEQAWRIDREHAADYLEGMSAALRGRHRVSKPKSWSAATQAWSDHPDPRVQTFQRELSVVFGDGRAVQDLIAVALDTRAEPSARRDALRIVLESQPKNFSKTLLGLRNDRIIGADAIRGLSRYEDPQVPRQLIAAFPNAKHEHRPAIIDALAARPSYSAELLDAVRSGVIEPSDLSASVAANIVSHNDPSLTRQLEELWGAVQTTSKEKQNLIAQHRQKLTAQSLANVDMENGHALFIKVCGNCHKMFGEGKSIGPDLTGSNRDNLNYLLENIIDPSRIVPAELRQSSVLLVDGRVINGTITQQTEATLTIQTINELTVISRDDVDSVRPLTQSLMPDGLLTPLSDHEVRDLIGYLQSTQ